MKPVRLLHLSCLLLTACARTLFGSGEPFHPWGQPVAGVSAEEQAGTLILRPAPSEQRRVLLFLHGFATSPRDYRFTLEQLAARGFVVHAPTLPDYFLGRFGYHRAVLAAAQRAYDDALADATRLGLGPPVVVGHSMGAGAGLLVSATRHVPAVLWAPVPLDLERPARVEHLLVLVADHDCIAKDQPHALLTALGPAAERAHLPGNHLGFTDRSGGEQYDCASPVSRDVQRQDAVTRTAAFFFGNP